MVKNSSFGHIVEEEDHPGFFKILRKGDLSTEIMVTLLTFQYLITDFLVSFLFERSNL